MFEWPLSEVFPMRTPSPPAAPRRRLFLLAAASAVVLAGCAGTATQESTGEYIDDTVITTRVKTALARDPEVSVFEVKVTTFRGTVQLGGFVHTEDQRVRAARIAAEVPGVRSVQNNISLRQ